MRGHKAFHATSAVCIRGNRAAHQHDFENTKQLFGGLEVGLIAGLMKSDQNLVR